MGLSEYVVGQSLVAERLVALHPGRFMFVPGMGWYVYDGRRWEQRSGLAEKLIEQAVVATAKAMIRDASNLDRADRETHLKVAQQCLANDAQLRGVVAFVGRHERVLTGVRELDADPFRLNVGNGTLDLLTGALAAHDPSDRITKITGAAYHRDARGPRWEGFLSEALADPQLGGSLQRLFGGPGLMGKVIEHTLPVIYGPGGSGKGTFIAAVARAFGDYAISAEPEVVMKRAGAHPTGEADLMGVRLAFVSESDDGRQLAAATMKRLTGGDTIRARRMRQDFVEFAPSHLLTLITNHLPTMPSGDDPAIWRRVRVIPFDRPPVKVDKRLGDHLAEEADAILAWLVSGFRDYWDHGSEVGWPESVMAATRLYRDSADLLGQFLAEATMHVDPSAAPVPMGQVYGAWKVWLAANAPDAKPGRIQDLLRHLRERGEVIRAGSSRNKGSALAGRMLYDDESIAR